MRYIKHTGSQKSERDKGTLLIERSSTLPTHFSARRQNFELSHFLQSSGKLSLGLENGQEAIEKAEHDGYRKGLGTLGINILLCEFFDISDLEILRQFALVDQRITTASVEHLQVRETA